MRRDFFFIFNFLQSNSFHLVLSAYLLTSSLFCSTTLMVAVTACIMKHYRCLTYLNDLKVWGFFPPLSTSCLSPCFHVQYKLSAYSQEKIEKTHEHARSLGLFPVLAVCWAEAAVSTAGKRHTNHTFSSSALYIPTRIHHTPLFPFKAWLLHFNELGEHYWFTHGYWNTVFLLISFVQLCDKVCEYWQYSGYKSTADI